MSRADGTPRTAAPRVRRRPIHGLAALARSLGEAAGFVRRLVPIPPEGAATERRQRANAPLAGKRIPAFQERRRYLAAELERLEAALERAHMEISQGTGIATRADDIERRIRQARQLREQARQRREELDRLERHVARQRKLALSEPRAPSEPPAGLEASEEDRSPPRSTSKARRQRAADRIFARTEFRDQSERVAYQRIVTELFARDAEVRREAVQLLSSASPKTRSELLRVAAEDRDVRVQLAALKALIGDKHPESAKLFKRHLYARSSPVRIAALRGIVSIDAPSSERLCLAALEDSDVAVRKSAASMLGWGMSARAMKALLSALADPDSSVRAAATASLGAIGHDRTVLSLIRRLGDDAAIVRDAAERSLRGMLGNDDFEAAASGATGEARVQALKDWWRTARVNRALAGTPEPRMDSDVAISERPPPIPAARPAVAPRVAAAARSAVPSPAIEPAPGFEDEPAAAALAGIGADGDEAAEALGIGGEDSDEAVEAFEGIGGEDSDEAVEAFEGIGGEDSDEAVEAFEGIDTEGGDEAAEGFEGIGVEGDEEEEGFENVFGGDDD